MQYHFEVPNTKISLSLKTSNSFPLWSYGSYLSQLDLYYRKIILLDRLQQLIVNGISDNHLFIGAGSLDKFPKEEKSLEDFSSFSELSMKADSPAYFWNQILVRKRPAVFYEYEGTIKPVLPLAEGTLGLEEAKVTSPGSFTVQGLAEFLIKLFFEYGEVRRREDIHHMEMSERSFRILREMAEAARNIEDPAIPEGYRRYMRQVFEKLVYRHQRDLEAMDIGIIEVNLLA